MYNKRFLCLGVVILILTFGCTNQPNKTVDIGVILPLTGPIASGGVRVLNGIQLAVEQYEQDNDLDISLIIEDSQAQPSIGVNVVNKLINIDKVNVIIGDLTSGVTLAIAPIVEKNKIVLMAPGASNPKVRNAGDYIFRNWVSDDFDGTVAAMYLYNKLEKKRAILLNIQNEYGVGLKNAFSKHFESLGGEIVFQESFIQGQQDFRSVLNKIKTKEFDSLYLAGQPKEMGYMIRQFKELGMSTTIFSNASVEEKDFMQIAGDIGIEIFYTSSKINFDSEKEYIKIFYQSYTDKFNEKPDIASAHGYDAAKLLLNCIDSSEINTDQIKECLYTIRDFKGITGDISFDKYGDVIKGIMVKKITELQEVVELEFFKPNI